VTIETLDFEELIKRYDRPHTFFYCDPPYYLPSVAYTHALTVEDHARLARCLSRVTGKWLLSYNDVPEVRELYRPFRITRVAIPYSISTNKTGQRTTGREILIRNY